MTKSENILITGCAGFIGSHTVCLLVNKYPNYHICNLDSLTYAENPENLRNVVDAPNYTFLHGGITEEKYINSVLKPINLIA